MRNSRPPLRFRTVSALAILLALPLPAATPQPESDAALAARIARVENGLLPAAQLTGAKNEPWTLSARMAFHRVPGVSIAVINHGAIEWTRSYGVMRAGENTPVTPDTLFQAASISKSVAATAALQLVESGQLSLDGDVNAKLVTWKIPTAEVAGNEPVTLRKLLSHTAGLTVQGFEGYASGAPLPTLGQILDGVPPANSEPVRIDFKPGTKWRYSDGGYAVLQQLLVDVSGRGFLEWMHDRVLLPAGMTASTFAQPLPVTLASPAASGHDEQSQPIAGGSHVYPEMAASGLWSTPGDLARFGLVLLRSYQDGTGGLVSPATAKVMLSGQEPNEKWSLGFNLHGEGDAFSFSQGGASAGFRSLLAVYPRTGRGVVVMTNSDNGVALTDEILRALAHEYAWPDYQVVEKTAVPLAPMLFDAFVGRYERESTTITFFRRGERFFMKPVGQPRAEIFALNDHEFFLLDRPEIYSFQRSAAGEITHLIKRMSPPQIFRRMVK